MIFNTFCITQKYQLTRLTKSFSLKMAASVANLGLSWACLPASGNQFVLKTRMEEKEGRGKIRNALMDRLPTDTTRMGNRP